MADELPEKRKSIHMKTIGAILLVIGLVMTVFTGFFVFTKTKVADIGSTEVRAHERAPIYWSPVTGGILAVAGILLLGIGKRMTHSGVKHY